MRIVPFRFDVSARRYYHLGFRRTPGSRDHPGMRRTTAFGAGALVLGGFVAAGLAVRLARLEPMLVEGGSMRPTLDPGHRIAVAPLVRPPRRGDLVVLSSPRSTGGLGLRPPDPRSTGGLGLRPPDPRSRLEVVKRVVGLPGERVRLHAGRLEVDGQAVPEPYLPGGHRGGDLDLELGPAHYLVLGDHRAASTDGRDFGPVPADALVGQVRLAYWPPRRLRRRG
jgi:signal peptidase I